MAIYRVPTQNSLQYTLDAQLAAGGTSLTLNQSVTSVIRAPGVMVIDRIDSAGNTTASKREYITFTGVSGAQLTGLSRGLAGSTDQVHAVGAIVEFTPDVLQEQEWYSVYTTEHNESGQHTAITASSASIAVLAVRTHATFSGASVTGLSITTADSALQASGLASGLSIFTAAINSTVFANLQGAFVWSKTGALVTSLLTLNSNPIIFQRSTKNQTITNVWAGLQSAPSLGVATFDVNWASGPSGTWTSIFSTKPTIDVGEYTTDTAATPAVLSFTSLASGILLRPEIEQPQGAGDLLVQVVTRERV